MCGAAATGVAGTDLIHCCRVRTHLRRYVRRTNAHSRKLANRKACVALWVAWYNFVRVNTTVRMTPCMAAGVTDHIWNMTELLQSE